MLCLFVTLLSIPTDAPLVKYQKAVHNQGRVLLQFEAENPNKQAVHFVGYTPDSYSDGIPAGEIRPIYQIQIRQSNADWKAVEMGHCGTGRGVLPLEPQSKVLFNTVIPEGDWAECRIGIAWSSDPKAKGSIAWSQAIQRDAMKPNP